MSLNSISDIQTEVLVRGQANTSSGQITDAMLNNWLQEKHRWAASYKKWPFTEGRVETTFASLVTDSDGELRGEFPEGWKPDSIRMLQVGGKRLRKINHYSYRRYREDAPDDQEKMFTDYGRQYFINPNADVSGSVVVWGQYTPTDIDVTDDTAKTIFSGIEEDGNEAIVEAMLGELERRNMRLQHSQTHMAKSRALLEEIWRRFKDEQYGYQNKEPGMFERINIVDGGMSGDIRRDRWY